MRPARATFALILAACGPTSMLEADGGGPSGEDGGGGDGEPDARVVNVPDAAPCVAQNVEASEKLRPVDIIWVIDNSGSMSEEESRVQNNINSFAATIAMSGADYRVIMITAKSDINVPPPLGGGPRLLHIDQKVGSHDALQLILQRYPDYKDFLRPGAVRHFVVVSDDDSDLSKSAFESQLAALTSPGFPDGFVFHAIVAPDPPHWPLGGPCFGLSADKGEVYMKLQQAHGGLFFSLCSTDWSPLWGTLGMKVSEGLKLPCAYAIPDPPAGQDFDYDRVNVIYTPSGGTAQTVPFVGDASNCGAGGGWYYDDPTNPSSILVCPSTCNVFENDATGQVDVAFGCATVIDG